MPTTTETTTMPTTTETTTKSKLFLVMVKPIPKLQLKKGQSWEIDLRKLVKDGYWVTSGHGSESLIPKEYFSMELETIERTVVQKITEKRTKEENLTWEEVLRRFRKQVRR